MKLFYNISGIDLFLIWAPDVATARYLLAMERGVAFSQVQESEIHLVELPEQPGVLLQLTM